MKNFAKKILQKLLGIHLYLFIFSLFVIIKLRWDKNEKDFLTFLKTIPNDGIILDIGANIGVMTRYFAMRKKNAEVFSFEPVPFNFRVLKRIVSFFRIRNVKIFKLAVGERNDTIEIVIPKNNNVTLHGLCHVEGVDGEKGDFDRIQTKMIYLDGFSDISNRSKKVVGIKLDVENYEYHVLEGAKNLIQTDRPSIYAELWDNENRQKCFELMKNMNYETYSFEGKKMIAFNKTNYKGQNFVFLPK